MLGQRTIERNQLLVKIAKSKLNRKRDDKSEKVTRPEELVRLYDLLLQVTNVHLFFLFSLFVKPAGDITCVSFSQNVADLSDLISSGRDRKPEEVAFEEECQRKSLAFRAERFNALTLLYFFLGWLLLSCGLP